MFNTARKKANKVAEAIIGNRYDLAAELLRAGAAADGKARGKYFTWHEDATSLMAAVREGQVVLVELLIERGANVQATDERGRTAMHYLNPSDTKVNDKIIKLLVAAGADINAQDDRGQTPLVTMLDAFKRHGSVEALLQNGARADVFLSYYGSLLYVASNRNEPGVTELLIKHGVDVNVITPGGTTALHRAASEGNGDVVRVLLEHGANASAQDSKMNTAADVAQEKHPGIANFIRKYAGMHVKGDAGWVRLGDDEIALISEKAGIQYRLTEIFNFTRGEATLIARNLETGTESITVREFERYRNSDVIAQAAQALQDAGGSVARLPSKPVRLIEKAPRS